MSYYDDFLKALKKKGLTIEDVSDQSSGGKKENGGKSTSTIGTSKYAQEFEAALNKRGLTLEDVMQSEEEEDIAPITRSNLVQKFKEEKGIAEDGNDSLLDFFQKGAFEDGYQFGDVTKSILGTVGDIGLNAFKGVANIGEGLGKAVTYGVAGVADLIGQDDYADDVRWRAQDNFTERLTKKADNYLDQYSLLGRTSDAIMQGVGQVGAIMATGGMGAAAGLGTAGTTALTTSTMGLSSFGSGVSEAYQNDATDEEAIKYGLIAGASDALSELLFGGLGKMVNAKGLSVGVTGLDDVVAKKASSLFSSQIAKNFAEFGVKASAEGLEEVVAGISQAMGKKLTYMSDEELSQILKDENLLEQFVVGAATSGMMQSGIIPGTESGSLKEANATGRDFITGLSQNEQAVIKKETEKRIAEQEASGKKLTNKEKADIEAKVEKDMEKGYISTDTIEEALGGETYKTYKHTVDSEDALQKEFDTLNKMKQGEMTGEQIDKRTELKEKLEYLKKNSKRSELKTKLGEEVRGLIQNDRLTESYNERSRRQQVFQADLSQYNEKQQAVVKKAAESGILNNTNRTHEFVDMVAKISADTGVLFDFTNNAKLKESGFALNGATVNGYKSPDGIVVNVDSAKSRSFVVGHEITHVMEGTELYGELQKAVLDYAKTKGEYDSRLESVTALYEKYAPDADPLTELTSDLVGEYLFSDPDFINNLSTKHRNVFQQIYDEVKHLLTLATAGSKEARELEQVKYKFDQAYRELGKGQKNTAEGGVKYSLNSNAKTELHKAIYDKNYPNEVLLRDETPAIMTAQKGVKNLPMAMNASHIRENVFTEAEAKSLGLKVDDHTHYHGLGEDFFLQVIDGLDNVKEAYRGTKNASDPIRGENYFLLVSEFTDQNGNTVNVPVYINEHGQFNRVFVDINKISTVFGRDNFRDYINRQVSNKNLVRIKNRSTQTSEPNALIAEGYGEDASSNANVAQKEENVNRDSKNSLSEDGAPQRPVADPLTDLRLEVAQEEVAPAAENATSEATVSKTETADDNLTPMQAQLTNIYVSNIRSEAERNNISLEQFYMATEEMNAFSPTKTDAAKIADALEPIVEQLGNENFRGYLDKIRSYSQSDTTVSKTGIVDDMFPDDTMPIQKEYEFLKAEEEDIAGAIAAYVAAGDLENAEKLWPEYQAVQERIAAIESDETDRLASIEDADAPPERMENEPEDVADDVPLTKTLVTELAKTVRAQLGLPAKRVAEVRDLIERYSKEEFPSKAHLYTEIAEKFGTYTEAQVDEDLKGVKALLRTYGIQVSDSIKSEIADYGKLMRSNFGKIRFSNEGLPVDVAYREFQEALPGYFPESIYVPTDQLLRIIEVANMDTTIEQAHEIDWQTLEEVTDTIMNGVAEFKQNRKETLANTHGKESFQSLMEDADRYVPPIAPWNRPPTKAEMNASPDDIAPTFDTGSGQQAFMPEAEEPKKVTRKQLHEDILDNIKTTFREKGFEFDDVLKKAKDLSTFATVDNTPQRVMEKALGYKEGQALSDLTVNKVAQNETEGIRWLNSFTDKKIGLLAKIAKQYNIKPGSKASAAAQMYAEGFYVGENDAIIQYGDRELAMDFPDAKVQENIKKLARDPRIRQIYDETLAAINESRTRNAYPEIPRLDNYFLHFRAMEDTFSRLGLPFNPNDIRAKDLPTDLNGVTADLKPGQPYFASAKHREGKRTSFDLLGGLEKYLTSAKNQIYHIDDIQTLRALRNYVAESFGQAAAFKDMALLSDEEADGKVKELLESHRHLSTFAKFLNEEANIIAGKTDPADRGIEAKLGRRALTFLDTLNRQVGANMVGFNVSSALTNFLAPVQAFAKSNKFDFVKAMAQTASNKIGSIFGNGDTFAEESPVMIRRKGAERFYRTPYEKVADAGYVLMGVVDDLSTELVARTKYNELTRKGMDSQQAHIETDKWVSRLMGDRSLGQQPHLYNSRIIGLVTKFQLEVRNQLDSQFYDTIQEAKVSTEYIENKLERNAKKAAKITSTFVQLAVMQHLFGKAFESVAGYNPAFDIIEAIVKAFGWDDEEEEEDTVLDNLEEAFLSLLGDMPYSSIITGGRIPIQSALPISQLLTGKDQYGNEKDWKETFAEALPYYLLPGGYGQIKKTKAGLQMFDEDLPIAGSYTDSGNLRFPVEDTLPNRVQAGLFGQWASANARDYFDNERKPLKENQIQELIDVDIPIREYWDYREELSKYDTVKEKIQFIESLDLPVSKKNILVNNAADRKTPIDLTDYDQYADFEEFDFASKNPEKYSFLKENNISYADYSGDEDAKEFYDGVYSWVNNYPDKVTVSKAVTSSVVEYRKLTKALDSISADKDAGGKTINGSAKEKKIAYINSLDIDYGAKLVLFKNEYNADDTYNYAIVEYLNSRQDISFDEMNTILKELGFHVTPDGYITW